MSLPRAPSPPRPALLLASLVASLGGLLFGFDTAVISGAEGTLRELYAPQYALAAAAFGSEAFWHGVLVASALFGTIVGAVAYGKPADRYGRIPALVSMGALYLVSALGSALAWDALSFTLFRFIGGIAVGGSSVVSPMYVAEISPARLRGRLVALVQFNIVLGIFLAYLSNLGIATLDLGTAEWRWMFGVEALPALAFTVLLMTIPESPRWLVARNRSAEAKKVLARVGTDEGSLDGEIRTIEESLHEEAASRGEAFFTRRYLKPILLAVAIAAFNQLSGINAVIYYTRRIFEMAGYGEFAALGSSAGIGLVNIFVTLAAMAVIDRFGRRALLIAGSIGYITSLTATAYAFHTGTQGLFVLLSLFLFIASHAFGQGAVIWVFISEIFPNRVRARGLALGCFTHWILAALISQTFPMFAESFGGAIFAFYALCMVGQLFWALFLMPETKGIPLEQIEQRLGIK